MDDRFSGWYLTDHTSPYNTSVFPDPAADTQTFSITAHHYGYASWFHIFGPNKMNDLSVTYAYRTLHTQSFGLGGDYPSKLGLRGVPENAFPRFAPSGFSALGSTQQERRQDPIKTETILDSFIWVRGRHVLRFGFQGTYSSNDAVLLSAISGSFSFSTLPTGLPGNSLTGSGLASLLLGFPTGFGELATEELDRRSWYLAGFVADDWAVNSRLTLNLGLRWETPTPRTEVNDYQSVFDLASRTLKLAGQDGYPRTLLQAIRLNIRRTREEAAGQDHRTAQIAALALGILWVSAYLGPRQVPVYLASSAVRVDINPVAMGVVPDPE